MIKKLLTIFLIAVLCICSTISVSAYTEQYVFDYENALSYEELQELESTAEQLENEYGYCVMFCITDGETESNYAQNIYDKMYPMSWIYLIIASIFEVGWPFGMKMASSSANKLGWIIFAVIAMALSGIFLYFAQKQIPIGIAYAIWTGIGAVCTFALGVWVFQDSINLMKIFGVSLIILGIVLLEISQ